MEWRVPARDTSGRDREIVVRITAGAVVVVPPPGEGLYLTPDQADTLAYAVLTASSLVSS